MPLVDEFLGGGPVVCNGSCNSSSASPNASTSTPKRIVSIQSPEMWTGIVNEQTFLEIPQNMDLKIEEDAWFASGGDNSGLSFAQYLVSKGAVPISVEIWNINYL